MSRKSAATLAAIAMNRARSKKLTPEQRAESARKASIARWAKARAAKTVPEKEAGPEKSS